MKREQHCRLTYFGGEAFPNLWFNMGPGCLSAYLDCMVRIRPETVWFEDLAMDRQEILSARIQPDNFWWRKTVEFARIATERSAGRWVVGTQRRAQHAHQSAGKRKAADAHH